MRAQFLKAIKWKRYWTQCLCVWRSHFSNVAIARNKNHSAARGRLDLRSQVTTSTSQRSLSLKSIYDSTSLDLLMTRPADMSIMCREILSAGFYTLRVKQLQKLYFVNKVPLKKLPPRHRNWDSECFHRYPDDVSSYRVLLLTL